MEIPVPLMLQGLTSNIKESAMLRITKFPPSKACII